MSTPLESIDKLLGKLSEDETAKLLRMVWELLPDEQQQAFLVEVDVNDDYS